MKAIRNLATLAGVAMLFATFGASRARAQVVAEGTFKLPYRVQWGPANLGPGSYRFKVKNSGDTLRVVTVWSQTEENDPIFILGLGHPSSKTENAVLCECRGPVCIVHTLQLGVTGETLTFTAPKSEHIEREARGRKNHTQKRQTVAAIETVPIVFSGK